MKCSTPKSFFKVYSEMNNLSLIVTLVQNTTKPSTFYSCQGLLPTIFHKISD